MPKPRHIKQLEAMERFRKSFEQHRLAWVEEMATHRNHCEQMGDAAAANQILRAADVMHNHMRLAHVDDHGNPVEKHELDATLDAFRRNVARLFGVRIGSRPVESDTRAEMVNPSSNDFLWHEQE